MGKFLTSTWIVALSFMLLLGVRVVDPDFIKKLRLQSFDTIQTLSIPKKSKDIVLLNIGEKSLKDLGQWPWPRDYLANIILKLRHNRAQLITFMVFFPENDRMGKDFVLKQVLETNPGVILSQTVSNNPLTTHGRHIGHSAIGDNPAPWLYKWEGLVKNIDSLEKAASGVGMSATPPEVDNLVRRIPLMIKVGEQVYPNLTIEFIRVATGDPSYQVKTDENGIVALRVPGFNTIKTDSNSNVWIDWSNTFDSLEVTEEDWSKVKGKHIFIGTTAAGLANLISTPAGAKFPHEIQASLTQTVIEGTFINRPNYANGLELFFIAVGFSFLLLFVPRSSVVLTIPMFIIYLGMCIGYPYWEWVSNKALIDMSYPLLAGFILFSHLLFNKFAVENRLKKQIKKQFEHYLAPAMVKKLQDNPELLRLGGDTREMTFLFTDIRGFTPISEQYKTNPQGLTALINRFLTPMTWTIMNNFGTIDKYMGDCIMAFWNAPLDVPDQQVKAVETSILMLRRLKELNAELEKEVLMPINIGIGINTGTCVVGNMGSDQRFDYSVIGDAVNLAARLEGQSKEYGVKIILGEETVKGLPKDFFCLELDSIAVKGKTEPTKIFTVLDIKTHAQELVYKKLHKKFLDDYRKKDWKSAIECIDILKDKFDGCMLDYYLMMSDRIEGLKHENLPDNWDGVYIATTK